MKHPFIGPPLLRFHFDAHEIAGRRGVELRILVLIGFPQERIRRPGMGK